MSSLSLAAVRNRNAHRLIALGGLLLLTLGSDRAQAACPSQAEILARLEALPLTEAARTERFGLPVPESLYTEAIARPGTPIPSRTGKIVQGTMLVPLAVEVFWRVINDDDHHDEGGYLPLQHSEVVAGTPGRGGRETLQYYRSWGLGRWWVNRLDTSPALYDSSDGALWELYWRDAMGKYSEGPPVALPSDVPSVDETWGAWLLVSLDENCTLVEYVAGGEPGGIVGALHWLGLTRTLKVTFRGMVEMVGVHLAEPHPLPVFHRPDGTPIEP